MRFELRWFDARAFTVPIASDSSLLCFKQVNGLPIEVLLPFGRRMSLWVIGEEGESQRSILGLRPYLMKAEEAHPVSASPTEGMYTFWLPTMQTHTHTHWVTYLQNLLKLYFKNQGPSDFLLILCNLAQRSLPPWGLSFNSQVSLTTSSLVPFLCPKLFL